MPQPKTLHVHSLPDQVDAASLGGATCVVIDVLRATTTITVALESGASAVIPCLEIADAQRGMAMFAPGRALLAGERGGMPIAGFHLGNSPSEFSPQRVRGKTVLLTTTNGTRAIIHCVAADAIYIASLLNAARVSEALAAASDVHLVCAGTDGSVTLEDVLLAGCLVRRLQSRGAWSLYGTARTALAEWKSVMGDAADGVGNDELRRRLEMSLRGSAGGKNLLALGLDADIAFAARIDTSANLPRFDPASGRITAHSPEAG